MLHPETSFGKNTSYVETLYQFEFEFMDVPVTAN